MASGGDPAENSSGDAGPGAPPPRANPDLVGHEAVEQALRRLYDDGRLPHAILLGGPRGIGKATLAFRLARFVLAHPGGGGGDLFGARSNGLALAPDSGVFRRVAAGGHADLLTVEREYDPKRRRLRGEIVVDDTREIGAFLRLTAAEDGWRVVVVDGADEMNRNAANAVLKILEEPPRRTLLLLVSHSPGRLLPTIRSRCRQVALAPLAPASVRALLTRYAAGLDDATAGAAAALAGGSIGRALELAAVGGIDLYRALLRLLATPDPVALHGFVDPLLRPDAEDSYRVVAELIGQFLARVAVAGARGDGAAAEIVGGEGAALRRLVGAAAGPADWVALRDRIAGDFARTDQLNLDRKQVMLGAFFAIDRLAG